MEGSVRDDGSVMDKKYTIRTEQGPARGDLYELEQKTYFHVVNVGSGKVVMTLEELMEASLSPENGSWDNYSYSGAKSVEINQEEGVVTVLYHNGNEERIPLPD